MSLDPVRRAGARQWRALAALVAPALLVSVDRTVLSMAAPPLSQDLEPISLQLLWTIGVYGGFLAALPLLMGSLGDRIGRRRVLLSGSAVLHAAWVLAASVWSAKVLHTACPDGHRRR
ncbi:MFS transporter [Streptomyces sp. NPDC017936]|uniref:MFS transporter n=1 Tax=Streptomyces sp. NPDC017936 TaxID=3365016 RepID=UPI0037B35DAF